MAYKIISPLPVVEGGTAKQSFTAYTVICGGTTTTGALQNVVDTGENMQLLTSNGAGALPTWQATNNPTFFEELSSDPSSPAAGQTWFNTTTDVFKGCTGTGTSTWTTKTSMNTGRYQLAGAGDDGADDLSFGGDDTGSHQLTTTERYDGTGNTWTAKTGMNTGRVALAGGGTAADALSFGGSDSGTFASKTTERYDGTGNTWTAKTNLNTGVVFGAGAGIDAADMLSIGGLSSYTVELYNGAGNTWTAKSSRNSNKFSLSAAGVASTALSFTTSNCERYDGSGNSWTTKASPSGARLEGAGASQTTDALAFGGGDAGTINGGTQTYSDTGNSWATETSMNTARNYLAGAGSITDALSFGGNTNTSGLTVTGATERYASGSPTIVTFDITAV